MLRVTNKGAIILRAMLEEPTAKHNAPALAETTGIHHATVAYNLNRFAAEGWVTTTKEFGVERGQPSRHWKFTAAGRAIAREELKTWTFTDG